MVEIHGPSLSSPRGQYLAPVPIVTLAPESPRAQQPEEAENGQAPSPLAEAPPPRVQQAVQVEGRRVCSPRAEAETARTLFSPARTDTTVPGSRRNGGLESARPSARSLLSRQTAAVSAPSLRARLQQQQKQQQASVGLLSPPQSELRKRKESAGGGGSDESFESALGGLDNNRDARNSSRSSARSSARSSTSNGGGLREIANPSVRANTDLRRRGPSPLSSPQAQNPRAKIGVSGLEARRAKAAVAAAAVNSAARAVEAAAATSRLPRKGSGIPRKAIGAGSRLNAPVSRVGASSTGFGGPGAVAAARRVQESEGNREVDRAPRSVGSTPDAATRQGEGRAKGSLLSRPSPRAGRSFIPRSSNRGRA